MATLEKANQELFRRGPDECFASFDALYDHATQQQRSSKMVWIEPEITKITDELELMDTLGGWSVPFNDWSFAQTCRLAGVNKPTLDKLSHKTASQALNETLPAAGKPRQLLVNDRHIRSIHGVAYTRLWDIELLDTIKPFCSDFQPPQRAMDGTSTGLYAGEQDMFCFFIDPTGWVEIGGEAFAPGFFIWNSEVGRRSLGVQTFWFQKVCQNHIVWDATEVIDFSRKHTTRVYSSLKEIHRLIEQLATKRDERRDGFAKVIRKAMSERLGSDAEEATKQLTKQGIPQQVIKEAMKIAEQQGGFTIFSLVDALTRVSQQVTLAGNRVELDSKIGSLLSLATAA